MRVSEKPIKTNIVIALCIVSLLFGFGFGFVVGTAYTIQTAIRGLNYIDNINIELAMNETKVVNAMLPYIPEDTRTRRETHE